MAARRPILHLMFGLTLAALPACAAQVTLDAVADNTLYQDPAGATSNGAGAHLFAGNTDDSLARRAVVRFDLSAIPAGAVVTGVTLRLNLSRTQAGPMSMALHRLLADWGEGTSDAAANEGRGAPAAPGDATWLHRSFATTFWATAGGDFAPAASASIPVDAVGPYAWGSTPAMVADTQAWVDGAPNHGWILIGNETGRQTTKRFDSRNNALAASRPQLVVDYTAPAAGGACCDASGGCTVVAATSCAGSYQGDGTGCGAGLTCGACCDGASCAYRVQATCASYRGDGSSCSPDPCITAPTGACCDASGGCTVVAAASCAGGYQGNGTACGAGGSCGACCDTASCAYRVAGTCTSYGGDGSRCTPEPCVQAPRGACCDDTTCSEVTASECQATGGIYQGDGQTCATDPCGDRSRACCLPGDTCTVMNRDVCRAMGGDDKGGDSTCNPSLCGRGACCLGGGCVADERGDDCVGAGGSYHGPGSSCSPDPCLAPCDPGLIRAIARLLAVKSGARADVSMSWVADADASGYNVWHVRAKADVPLASSRSLIARAVAGCAPAASPACAHAGAVSPASGAMLYYNVLGVCDGVEAAN